MADVPNRPLSRDQIAEVFKSPQAIKQFERLQQTTFATPTTIEEVSFAAGSAATDANQALGLVQQLQDEVDALLAQPVGSFGDLALQNSDSVDITGGAINGTPIGQNVTAAGSFATLTASGATLGPTTVTGAATVTGPFGCNGKPPQSAAPIATVATTGATNTTPFGYTTAGQANDIVTKLNLIIAALKANGIAI